MLATIVRCGNGGILCWLPQCGVVMGDSMLAPTVWCGNGAILWWLPQYGVVMEAFYAGYHNVVW